MSPSLPTATTDRMRACSFLLRASIMAAVLVLGTPFSPCVEPVQAEDRLPVWVFVDADTPLDGADVRVISQGRRLRQADPSAVDSTNENGVLTLEFDALPRSFMVVVSGGRAEGRRTFGQLRATANDYEPGRIVYVNPATTLVVELLEHDPGLSATDASHMAKRILGIPQWHNLTVDLQRSDRWFGGDEFLARSRWRIGRTIKRLAMH